MRSLSIPLFLALSACAAQPTVRPLVGPQVMSPALAVLAAADAAPGGVPGRFGFVVQRAAWVGPRLFLNSYPDYRDQRNLSISIEPSALAGLRRAFGVDLSRAFMNKPVVVDGVARRVRIDFTYAGRPTSKYHYQTHVLVSSPGQIRITA